MTEMNVDVEGAVPPQATAASAPSGRRALIIAAAGVLVLLAFIGGTTAIGSRILAGEEIEGQVSHSGNAAEQLVSQSIEGLTVRKTADTLRLHFTFNPTRGQVCGVCQFYVGMADADGVQIDHFVTNRVHDLWENWRDLSPQDVQLGYEINPGIARRTRYVTVKVLYR
jgi:hypothetical protein